MLKQRFFLAAFVISLGFNVFDMILHCQALLRLPGESPGADREVQFARDNGVPVLYEVQDADA